MTLLAPVAKLESAMQKAQQSALAEVNSGRFLVRSRAAAKPMNWQGLAGMSPPDREWLISHWLGYGPSLMVGRGGIGKTLVAQQMSTCLATQRDFLDSVSRPLKVLMWACEDSHDELWRRQCGICTHYGVPMEELDGKLVIMPRLGHDNTLFATEFGRPMWTPVMGELEAHIGDYAADVVVLDNIGQVFGANENDRHHVTEFVNGLVGACNGRKVAIMLLGHPARSSGSEFSGSSAWENAVRMRWFLSDSLPGTQPSEDEPGDAVRYLSKRKANYSSRDYRQFFFRDGVLVPDDSAAARADDPFRKGIARKVLISAIGRLAEKGEHVSKNDAARNFAPAMILKYKLGEGFSKPELTDAMRDLILDGSIREDVVGQYPNRTKKSGLVVTK